MKIQDFFPHYKNSQLAEMAISTYQSRTALIKHNLLPDYGTYDLEELTAQDVNAIYHAMREEGFAQNTIFGFQAALRSFYKTALDHGYTNHNPMKNAERVYPHYSHRV